jgi:ribokinase
VITVVGSLNMDLFIETDRLPATGETVAGRNFRRAPGGKGANQAVAVARLGHRCAMIGAVGADAFGDELVAGLRTDGVDVTGVSRHRDSATGCAMIVVDSEGQNQIVVSPGANGLLALADLETHAALFRASRAVIVQLETPLTVAEAALRLACKSGVMTVFNPAPATNGSQSLLSLCDWVVPNESEASALTGLRVDSAEEAATAASLLKSKFGCRNVAITLGARGAWLDTESFVGLVEGKAVDAIDTVGAGDAFIGALVTRLVGGAEPSEAGRFACAAAALSVTRRGAQASMPTRQEVELFLQSDLRQHPLNG